MRSAVLAGAPATRTSLDARDCSRRNEDPGRRSSSVAFGLGRRIARLTFRDDSSGREHQRISSRQNWMRDSSSAVDRRDEEVKVRAASFPTSGGESSVGPADSNSAAGSLGRTLYVGLLVALWYLFNIYFNIYNKQVLILLFPVWFSCILFASSLRINFDM